MKPQESCQSCHKLCKKYDFFIYYSRSHIETTLQFAYAMKIADGNSLQETK